MKIGFIIFIFTILISNAIFADELVDFTGEWTFNKSKSEFGEGGDRFVPVKIKITQNENLMMMERTYQREYDDDFVDTLKFTLDGEENQSKFWRSPRIITANWAENGQSLTIETKITFTRDGRQSEMFSTDVWQLKDHSTLSRNFTIEGPLGQMKAIYIFNRMNL